MADRPIIFSGAMVRALLAQRKSQTRRLATSPLRRCVAGDRLYVRENFWWRDDGSSRSGQWATEFEWLGGDSFQRQRGYRLRPSIHMPRWLSRATLIVRHVRVEPLHAISEADAWAEGVCQAIEDSQGAAFGETCSDETRRMIATSIMGSGRQAFRYLWETLHGPHSWNANPDVIVLCFDVLNGNIDEVPS